MIVTFFAKLAKEFLRSNLERKKWYQQEMCPRSCKYLGGWIFGVPDQANFAKKDVIILMVEVFHVMQRAEPLTCSNQILILLFNLSRIRAILALGTHF